MNGRLALCALVVAGAAFYGPLFARAGMVEGRITDSRGAPIDAKVTLRSASGTQSFATEICAGKDGSFSIRDVPDGEYCLTVSRSGRYDDTRHVSVKGNALAAGKLGIVLESTAFYRIVVLIRAGVVAGVVRWGYTWSSWQTGGGIIDRIAEPGSSYR